MSRYPAARVAYALVCACFVFPAAALPWAHDWKVTDRLALGDEPVVASDAAGGVLVGSGDARFVRYDATLRETDVDDNFVRLYGAMSLYADGFQ